MKIANIIFLLVSLFMLQCTKTFAQDSSRMRISLLTCTPGAATDELYSTFGHSALRVTDSNSVTDVVYNYGTFNFDQEGFYIKFIRGKLKYELSVDDFSNFKFQYQMENRGITEQVLTIPAEEKLFIRHTLNENLKEENKYYLYDFFLDNCTTRLRDIIVKNTNPTPFLPAVMPTNFTFRNAIHQYLDTNKKYWGKLGIDILLGAPTDAVMTTSQQQFLPDNLMYALDATRNMRIVQPKQSLYSYALQPAPKIWFTPMVFFTAIFIFYVLLSLVKNKITISLVRTLDALLFFVTGLLGILLVFMWVGTDHTMTKNNYNLLWAWPMHIIYAFFVHKPYKSVKVYGALTAVFLCLLLGIWFVLAQQMNNALLPLVLLLAYRSGMRAFIKAT